MRVNRDLFSRKMLEIHVRQIEIAEQFVINTGCALVLGDAFFSAISFHCPGS